MEKVWFGVIWGAWLRVIGTLPEMLVKRSLHNAIEDIQSTDVMDETSQVIIGLKALAQDGCLFFDAWDMTSLLVDIWYDDWIWREERLLQAHYNR